MTIKEIDKLVKPILSKRKYDHSRRTAELAKQLAKTYGASQKKAVKAALLHDVGYFIGRSKKDRSLSHAGISARYAKRIGIKDKSVLSAIEWHTVGQPGLDTLGKIIFLADGIEPGRKFPMVDIIRRLAFKDLDAAILMFIQVSRTYLHQKGKRMSTHTIQMRDEIVKKRKLNGVR
ncbi:MAG TPA: HD domain-containing protein [Tissierellia bacterium]|nr:HD domain-containing protein [Tissierellia bacterium]